MIRYHLNVTIEALPLSRQAALGEGRKDLAHMGHPRPFKKDKPHSGHVFLQGTQKGPVAKMESWHSVLATGVIIHFMHFFKNIFFTLLVIVQFVDF